jgi:nicotinate-nucleotide pyrophosphorylase (carboxylating)
LTSFGPPWDDLREMVTRAVTEDLPSGDPTGAAVGPRPASASIVARQAGTVAGLVAVQITLDAVSDRLGTGRATASVNVDDGARVDPGAVLGVISGPADTLLAAERTLLNILTHLSGVATLTARTVDAVAGTGAVVRDTRKTLPGLGAAEKYAVRCGGAVNHRMSLSDAILVKDNHIAALGGVKAAVEAAKGQARAQGEAAAEGQATNWGAGLLSIEVEVDDLAELDEAVAAGAKLVLVDNMSLETTAEAVLHARRHGARVEASGGLHLGNIAAVAACGVDYLAIGALTHSAPALDIGLDWRIDHRPVVA